MRVNIYGDEFEGTPGEIVEAMGDKAWGKFETVDEYMEMAAKNIWKFSGKPFIIKGATCQERCLDFLNKLQSLGIAQVKEDN